MRRYRMVCGCGDTPSLPSTRVAHASATIQVAAKGGVMRIGAHVSVAGGYIKGLEYGVSIGAECIQVFAKSPRQWKGAAVDPEAAKKFTARRTEIGYGSVFTHTAYLLNLATTDAVLHGKTVNALADELVRAALLGAEGTVTHLGNDPGRDDARAAERAASVIREAYDLAGEEGSAARLLLENSAGAGSSFGTTFAQLKAVIDASSMGSDMLGVCLDTCHAFAFGMPLDTAAGWSEVIAEMDAAIGLDRLGLIHANDCTHERGSRKDRHAWIGDGLIGYEGFSAMLCAPGLAQVAVVTEMPGEVPEKDSENIARLKRLRCACR